MFNYKRRDKKDWVQNIDEESVSYRIGEAIIKNFRFKNFILRLMSVIYGYMISYLIHEPLYYLAHYIRTLSGDYDFNPISFFVFLGLTFIFLFIVYLIARPIRKEMKQELEDRNNIYDDITAIIFTLLIINIFIEPVSAISNIIAFGYTNYTIGVLFDNIIASILLLFIFLGIYLFAYVKDNMK